MNPNYTSTVTIYHKVDDAWQRQYLHGCSWVNTTQTAQSGTARNHTNEYTVRIPRGIVGSDFVASPGDIVILGMCDADIDGKTPGKRASEVLRANKPNAFEVAVVSDNTKHIVDKHYRLQG